MKERGITEHEENWVVIDVFIIILLMVSWLYTKDKLDQSLGFKCVQYISFNYTLMKLNEKSYRIWPTSYRFGKF